MLVNELNNRKANFSRFRPIELLTLWIYSSLLSPWTGDKARDDKNLLESSSRELPIVVVDPYHERCIV
jgi:hypothetical protein